MDTELLGPGVSTDTVTAMATDYEKDDFLTLADF